MLARLQFIAAAVLVMNVVGGDRQTVAAAPSNTLVFEGTVISIGTIDNGEKSWLITVKVKRVVSGEFSGPTFEFAVHSPARSGLEKGRAYTVEAVWNGSGYVVDENQWRRPKRRQMASRSPEPSNPNAVRLRAASLAGCLAGVVGHLDLHRPGIGPVRPSGGEHQSREELAHRV
jgi:hypothetical protein